MTIHLRWRVVYLWAASRRTGSSWEYLRRLRLACTYQRTKNFDRATESGFAEMPWLAHVRTRQCSTRARIYLEYNWFTVEADFEVHTANTSVCRVTDDARKDRDDVWRAT